MVFLKTLSLKSRSRADKTFPLNLPLFGPDFNLDFSTPVTMLVGENGSGKSTLLEGLAVASDRIVAGAAELADDASLSAARLLAAHLRLSWSRKTNRGFFLRAEDFYGYSRRLSQMHHDLVDEANELANDYGQQGRSNYALGLALGSIKGQAGHLKKQYESLEFRSHGESFLHFFSQRIIPRGLYLLDEPETPLSPQNQLTFLAVLHAAVQEGSQFIIATHAPILMAYPNATIYTLDEVPPQVAMYEQLEHVTLTRRFLNNPEAYLRNLFR